MSNFQTTDLKQLSNDELINLALESIGKDQETQRHAILLEHASRVKNNPETLSESADNFDILHLKIQQFKQS
ncbi:MAG: hypothetical protein AB4041_16320 [Microcystaceae cyanobacterium]